MLTCEVDSKEKRKNKLFPRAANLTTPQLLSTFWSFSFTLLSFPPLHSTCCKEWRRWPSPRLSRWCGWRQSRPAGCWSRSGSRREWSSSGGTWGRRSTVSPAREASRRGRSYKPWPPEERRPEEDTHRWDGNDRMRRNALLSLWGNCLEFQALRVSCFHSGISSSTKTIPQKQNVPVIIHILYIN